MWRIQVFSSVSVWIVNTPLASSESHENGFGRPPLPLLMERYSRSVTGGLSPLIFDLFPALASTVAAL
jgi:hypothetical protein